MTLIQPGRVCIKTRGKERNKACVIVEVIDNKYVLIDGLVRRRRCNINHLKFLDKIIKVKKFEKNEILDALVKEGILSKEKLEKLKKKEGIIEERKKIKKIEEKSRNKKGEKEKSKEKENKKISK